MPRSGGCGPGLGLGGYPLEGQPRPHSCAPGPAVDSDLLGDVDGGGETAAAAPSGRGPANTARPAPASLTSTVRTLSCSSSVTSTGGLPCVQALELNSATMRPTSPRDHRGPSCPSSPGPCCGVRDGDVGRRSRLVPCSSTLHDTGVLVCRRCTWPALFWDEAGTQSAPGKGPRPGAVGLYRSCRRRQLAVSSACRVVLVRVSSVWMLSS